MASCASCGYGLKLFCAFVRQLHDRALTYPVARGKIVVAHLRGLVHNPLLLPAFLTQVEA